MFPTIKSSRNNREEDQASERQLHSNPSQSATHRVSKKKKRRNIKKIKRSKSTVRRGAGKKSENLKIAY